MRSKYDIIIIGGGAAGTSAALTCLNRGKKTGVIANGPETESIYKAELVTNYAGLFPLTGKEIAERMRRQLKDSGADLIDGRALSVLPLGTSFGVAVGNDYYESDAVIIAVGITREKLYPGEAEYLGRGVSYCATCDGMLYRGKRTAVIGGGKEAYEDVEFLWGICSEVIHFPENGSYEIRGGVKADRVVYKETEYEVDGVFIIKDTVSISKLVSGIGYADGGIVTDRAMRTSVPGIFAAGDCTGKPYQLSKAAGEGNVAALSACDYLESRRNTNGYNTSDNE